MQREVIGTPGSLPFSPAIRCGQFIFVSGSIGVRPGTLELVPGGIEEETRQALDNLGATLKVAGSGLEKVVKTTVFLTDLKDYTAMNAVYRSFFPSQPPARSMVQVAGLVLGARVEIEAIALA